MLTMETQGFQLLLLLLCVVSTCWGQQVFLTLGSSPAITTNNTEILITTIGEDATGSLPSLTCHTDLTACCRSVADNNGMGSLGQWTYPNGSVILRNGDGQQFYSIRNTIQVIRLARRETTNPLTPTGSYCCTVPTTGGDMTLCANLVVSSVCMSLPPPTNGVISYSTQTLSDGTVATYNCDTGYTLDGGTTRTCGSGVWSESAPSCQTNCPELPPLTNGMIMYSAGSPENRPFLSSAVHSCNTGYSLTGGTTRVCGSGESWSGSPPTCQATCSDLTVPANGVIGYNMGTASLRPVDTVATYTCDTGYTLNGGTTRTCGSGVWSGSAPSCQTNCPDLPSLTNGMIMYSAGSTDNRPFFSIATYTCDTGYTLNGGTTRTCESDRVWSGSAPTCQISCGPPPSITNGSPGQPTSTMIGGEATFTCDTGYLLIGSETITCLSTGNWSSSPACQIPPPVYLSLSSTNYLSGLSEIPLSSVGEGSGLVCHTDIAGCCEGNTGDWYYPNGSFVMENGALYVSRGQMSISLMMSGTATAPGGLYCCVVPTSGGMSTACIVLASTDESSLCPQYDNTVAVVGGAVALVAVVTIVTGVVIVTYLVLRYKRGGKVTVTQDISLTDQGQSAAATYETVPAVYDEIPASKNVKGDYIFSQNNAYSTVSGREVPAAGVII